MRTNNKIKVLVVDDSAIVRKILSQTLDAEADIEVVGTAPDPYVARDKILALKPDVLTLDIEMPRMDGLTFLKKLMHYHPMPVIVISSISDSSCQTAMAAMRLGALDVMAKPHGPYSVGDLRMALAMKIRAAASARLREKAKPVSPTPAAQKTVSTGAFHRETIIAIGASTGGTEAVEVVLRSLPAHVPPIVIVQHIPAGFSRAFADRLNQLCHIEVKEAVHGDFAVPGRALVAPGDRHMLLKNAEGTYRVSVRNGPRVCYQRPSVDVLFTSVAKAAGRRAVGVILTGMGADGAEGMLRMKQVGAHNIAQNEATCVVYGMPKEAVRLGATSQVLSLPRISSGMITAASRPAR